MFNKFKNNLFSENGTKCINILFVLVAFIRNRGFVVSVFAVWLFYLYSSFKNTEYKSMKIFNCVLAVYAIAVIAFNLYFLINGALCAAGSSCPSL